MLHVVMAVKMADPSTNVSFPTNKSDNSFESFVLIPKEIIKETQTGTYVCVYKLLTLHACAIMSVRYYFMS